MPTATPGIKVNAVREHGGETVEVRLFGNNYDEAAAEAKRLEREEGLAMIHPFDDENVIAGQGTIGEFNDVCVYVYVYILDILTYAKQYEYAATSSYLQDWKF